MIDFKIEDPLEKITVDEAIEALRKLQRTSSGLSHYDCLNKAIEALQATSWIPVTEQLPKGADKSGELCENVWLFFDDGNVYPGWMNGITEKVYYLDNYSGSLMTAPISRVKMWQPRPQPPKEE